MADDEPRPHRPPRPPRRRVSARLRLTLSYAIFLVAAGSVSLFGVYVVLRYVPDYPLTAANPRALDGVAVASRQEILEAVINVSAVILVALALIGLAGGWILSGWILRPLKRINQAAQIAAGGNLAHRIALNSRNDEFRQAADNFDHMLDRLQDAFDTQERFAANASHELRTPLAVTSTVLDVALLDPDGQDYPALVERLKITNDRAIGITESLLRLADANRVTAVFEPVDLAAIAAGVVEENHTDAERHGVTVTSWLGPAPSKGDPLLLTQLCANLIQNAIRHNLSDGTVRITTRHDPARGTVTLRVENSGVRYTPEAAAKLVEPFLRGTGRVAVPSLHRGYGLGLTLVARIVDVHDGALTVTPRAEGGLDIAVVLPDQ